jgi:predicted dehydrogenase
MPSSGMAPHARRRVPRPPGTPSDGGDPITATGRTLRWGVVSTGSIARTVTRQIALLEDAALHAVSSRDVDTAAAFAREFGFATGYGDAGSPGYRRLAEDPDVDVVYVAAPHGFHFEVTRAILEAGKHALVEKSFTVTAWEAETLIALARERGVFLMEAVWTRFLPVYQRVLDLLADGSIGEVAWVQADLGFRATNDPRTRLWAPEAGGGALLDLAVYPLAWVLGALGFPSSLVARGALTPNGIDASTALTLSYDGGAQAQLLCTLSAHASRTLTFGGTQGTLRTRAPLPGPDGFTVCRGDDVREERFDGHATRYAYQLREVTRCIQDGLTESPTMPLSETLATMRLFDEARAQMGVVYPHDARAP